jgi:hypothetical protein
MREEAIDHELPPLLDDAVPAHLLKAEILNCGMCDEDGYRPNMSVCDHRDHASVNARGMAKVRAALEDQRSKLKKIDMVSNPIIEDLVDRQRNAAPPEPITDPEPQL